MLKSSYHSRFREIELIGRGNFGSATLVQDLSDLKIYVAKKIVLNNLKEKEQQSSLLEAKLLRDLKHPHIVSYRDSFIDEGILIIIMEYCEEGDLAFHIKRKRQKNEFFSEKLILNWFLQIALALNLVHEKRILHRDIKTSNIFLNSNGIVKLGDFGISKLLENTNDAAGTVVGTPYYMSPEVCENKPYSYKSDVWALGCVLYELCTLKHAFDANNLLGLVYKIVRDKQDPIPSIYSSNLNSLIQKMLIKNDKERPLIRDIFKDPFIEKTMREFIDNKGVGILAEKIPIKKTLTHHEFKKILDLDEYPVQSQDNQLDNETPYQKMMRRKNEMRRKQEEEMREAARQAHVGKLEAKQRKYEDLFGSSPNFKKETVEVKKMELTGGSNFQTIMSMDYNETQNKNLTMNKANESKRNDQDFKNNYDDTVYSQNFVSEYMDENNHVSQQIKNESYADDFEEYWSEGEEDIDNTRLTNKAPEREIDDIVNVYKCQLNENKNGGNNLKQNPILEEIKEASYEGGLSKLGNMNSPSLPKEQKIKAMKERYSSILGSETFKKVYIYLKNQRQLGTSEDIIQKKLFEMVGKNNLNHCFGVDQIIFLEFN